MKTKTLIWILGAWLLSLMVMMLTGCKTKTVVEYIAVHDTAYTVSRDTVTKIVAEHSTDTIRIETERVVTVTREGDTLKVVEWRDRWRDRYVSVHDTLKQSKTDTVYISKDGIHEKETTKQKSLLKPVMVVALMMLMVLLCYVIWKRKR